MVLNILIYYYYANTNTNTNTIDTIAYSIFNITRDDVTSEVTTGITCPSFSN